MTPSTLAPTRSSKAHLLLLSLAALALLFAPVTSQGSPSTASALTEGEISALDAMRSTWSLNWAADTSDACGNSTSGTAPFIGLTCDQDGHVTSISITASGQIPLEIGNFTTSLTTISLNGVSGPIPEQFYSLSGLTSVAITGTLSGSISASIGNLASLSNLTLRGGVQGSLPTELFALPISHLLLGGNQLSGALPSGLSGLNPQSFNISNNGFSGVFPSISGWNRLSLFAIDHNSIQVCPTPPSCTAATCVLRPQDGVVDETCLNAPSVAPVAPVSAPVAPVTPPDTSRCTPPQPSAAFVCGSDGVWRASGDVTVPVGGEMKIFGATEINGDFTVPTGATVVFDLPSVGSAPLLVNGCVSIPGNVRVELTSIEVETLDHAARHELQIRFIRGVCGDFTSLRKIDIKSALTGCRRLQGSMKPTNEYGTVEYSVLLKVSHAHCNVRWIVPICILIPLAIAGAVVAIVIVVRKHHKRDETSSKSVRLSPTGTQEERGQENGDSPSVSSVSSDSEEESGEDSSSSTM